MCKVVESTKLNNVKVFVHNPDTYKFDEFKKDIKEESDERRNEEGTH